MASDARGVGPTLDNIFPADDVASASDSETELTGLAVLPFEERVVPTRRLLVQNATRGLHPLLDTGSLRDSPNRLLLSFLSQFTHELADFLVIHVISFFHFGGVYWVQLHKIGLLIPQDLKLSFQNDE